MLPAACRNPVRGPCQPGPAIVNVKAAGCCCRALVSPALLCCLSASLSTHLPPACLTIPLSTVRTLPSLLKQQPGFGFITFEDDRDADDAVAALDGKNGCVGMGVVLAAWSAASP